MTWWRRLDAKFGLDLFLAQRDSPYASDFVVTWASLWRQLCDTHDVLYSDACPVSPSRPFEEAVEYLGGQTGDISMNTLGYAAPNTARTALIKPAWSRPPELLESPCGGPSCGCRTNHPTSLSPCSPLTSS